MKFTMNLPVFYKDIPRGMIAIVRNEYGHRQGGKCYYCGELLINEPPKHVSGKPINWKLFPPHFLKHPVHLQHNHTTGLTEGAVHAYCNAVLWQYEGR